MRQGYGHAYLSYPFRYMDAFRAAEREAREAGRGLWADASALPEPGRVTAPSDAQGVQVWVNFSSRVYHCPGTRYYGRTQAGAYMTQADAQRDGHRAAQGRECRQAQWTLLVSAPSSSISKAELRTIGPETLHVARGPRHEGPS